MKKILLLVMAVSFAFSAKAQTVDEIIETYFENIGGIENFKQIEGLRMKAQVSQQGLEIPIEIVQLKTGHQMTVISFQGKEIKQGVFDGETLWSTNFMTMQAEKSDAETTANFKLEMNDFMDPFIDYKEKGYGVELLGKETIDGAEAFKVKLTKEPVTIDGNEEENVIFYYFDTENFVPIALQSEVKSGPGKGMTQEVTFSDYQEVDGMYFPFSMTQGVKGQPSSPLTVLSIELNPEVDLSAFAFPEEITTEEKK